jgi:hypothetical protein
VTGAKAPLPSLARLAALIDRRSDRAVLAIQPRPPESPAEIAQRTYCDPA